MGCFWSSEAGSRARCRKCGRKAVNNLEIIDGLCEICISVASRRQLEAAARPRPLYGEYRCSCGRVWSSRLSWQYCYQICYRCRNQVYAYNQRELRPTDIKTKGNAQEHRNDLCQMCQQLDHYCGNFAQRQKTPRKMY